MKHFFKLFMTSIAVSCMALSANAGMPKVGEAAPDFIDNDTNGEQVALGNLKGKTVVLEWTNHKCPFVVKHYKSGNMQKLQKAAAEDDVVWISIISSAPEKQGYVSAEEANAIAKENGASPAHIIIDPDGMVGHKYGARTTPHMFVIDKEGMVAYMGAIDDTASADPDDAATAKNYVTAALNSLKAGTPIEETNTKPYGCSVKY